MQGSTISPFPALVLDDSCLVDRDMSNHVMGKVKDFSSIPNLYTILKDEGFSDVKLSYLGGLWVLFEFNKMATKVNMMNHTGVNSWFHVIQEACNDFGETLDLEDNADTSFGRKRLCVKTKHVVSILETFKMIIKGKVFIVRAKELLTWNPTFLVHKEREYSSEDEFVHTSINNEFNPHPNEEETGDDYASDEDGVPETVFGSSSSSHNHDNGDKDATHSKDPFGIYDLLKNKKGGDNHELSPSLSHPPGFTPEASEKRVENITDTGAPIVFSAQVMNTSQDIPAESHNVSTGLGHKTKKEWIKALSNSFKLNFLAIQETKMTRVSHMDVKFLWGNSIYDYVCSDSLGSSGGILCIWEASVFKKDNVTVSDNFIAIYGTWLPSNSKILFVAIYAPQQVSCKKNLWDYISIIVGRWNGETIIMGDFNEVQSSDERRGSCFNPYSAGHFDRFISNSGLVDVTLEGYAFTWAHPSASKMSKLDRFLVSDGIFSLFPSITALCLDRYLSDHRPILLREVQLDFGPTPFRFYHSWFDFVGQEVEVSGSKNEMTSELGEIDKVMDRGEFDDATVFCRFELKHKLLNVTEMEEKDRFQKSKVKWAVEGDENSKFFHGIINKRRSQLAIRGIFVDGLWQTEPEMIKDAFFHHFAARFKEHVKHRFKLNFQFHNKLLQSQVEDLEREACRKYWDLIGSDLCDAVEYFFVNGSFPKGCNSSFVALIPKVIDAKFVNDFRPISLIGSVYKEVTKVLANRLAPVIVNLIFDTQSAFVAGRQILDGPFILDEILHWCKRKKKQAMFFKVDFAKAYDSVRWDYLLEVLEAFGFGQIWCNWIRGTLNSAKASILINGSPSKEFSCYRGLKQGDPLAPYLFILVMESLHLSFIRVVDEAVPKGSHLKDRSSIFASFIAVGRYVDKGSCSGVPRHVVEHAASSIGCSIMSNQFRYLGVMVGEFSSSLKAWDDVILKLRSRLSKWKVKTLSIGGRLTLLKSVLGASSIYYMSIFKVPRGVLKVMEVIRSRFFNGVDHSEKKVTWAAWNKVIRALYGPSVGTHSTHLSSNWCSIVREVHKLKGKGFDFWSYCKKRIRNGNDTRFWFDCWIGDIPLRDKFPRLFALELDKEASVVVKLSTPIENSFRRSARGGLEQHLLADMNSMLDSVAFLNSGDRWVCDLASDGNFQVKDVRNFIDDLFLPCQAVPTRWVKYIPIKVNIFAWRARQDCLPTRVNLVRRGINIESSTCPICLTCEEDVNHIFFRCDLAQLVLRRICTMVGLDPLWLVFVPRVAILASFESAHLPRLNLFGRCFLRCFWWFIWRL
ncbi:RNA-directed DNA polymerase, eukaryota [Tanacetum coccineum]